MNVENYNENVSVVKLTEVLWFLRAVCVSLKKI